MTVLRSGSATDVGRVRGSNQDLHLVTDDLFAVADGMGGHAGGEVAARDAVEALQRAFRSDPSLEGLRHAVAAANTAVWNHSQQSSELRGMGTTLTALALVPDENGQDVLALANVGDSRAYLYTDGGVTQLTADHSLAEEKVRHGELTEAEAAVHPHRHILTRALGISPDVEVDVWTLRLRTGDRVLLCSDGLSNEVSIEGIAQVLASVHDPNEAAQALVAAANEHGGSDNITAVVVDVMAGGLEDAPATVAAGYDAAEAVEMARPARRRPPSPGEPVGDDGPSGSRLGEGAAPLSGGGGGTATALDVRPATAPPDVSPADIGQEGPPPPAVAGPAGERLSRRQRRRRAGIAPWFTVRVALFLLLLVGVVAAGYGFIHWYATDNWFVTVDGDHLVIYQGRPGGLLWFDPKLVDRTPVTTSEVLSIHLSDLHADVEETSLRAAKAYVDNLHQEYLDQQQVNQAPTVPSTTVPATTVPAVPTTVPPG